MVFSVGKKWLGLAICCALSSAALAATDVPGVSNFHQVNEQVYRGAQPTNDGFANLAKLGIRTIVDLREPGSRSVAEEKVVKAAGMRYVSVPLRGMSAPSTQDVVKVLTLLNDTGSGPVFVHCRRGADRTGTVLACYRIAHDRWENQKALDEAKSFGMSWMERAMKSYVMHYDASTAAPAIAVSAAQ